MLEMSNKNKLRSLLMMIGLVLFLNVNAVCMDSGEVENPESEMDAGEDFSINHLQTAEVEEKKGKCEIRIETNVKKSEIYLNGIYYGSGSLTVTDLLPGEYLLSVVGSGYKKTMAYIEVKKNYRLIYRVKLEKI
ncbi:MAG: PEGA domain-containing protein [Treponema sp.]|nr:PEGA domain-containing protein [Treponema sp.]